MAVPAEAMGRGWLSVKKKRKGCCFGGSKILIAYTIICEYIYIHIYIISSCTYIYVYVYI